MTKLGRNHHAPVNVRVFVNGQRIDYVVHVTRLKAALNGALRRFPRAKRVVVNWRRKAVPA
jgi:hypothetical protein